MQNQESENNFEMLIEESCGALKLTYQQLKEKYKDYLHCLMEYIEKGVSTPVIEVRFKEQLATLSFGFNESKHCTAAFLFFYNVNDEDSFIEYLNEDTGYDFKRSSWIMPDSYLKVNPSICTLSFYFYK